MYKELIKEFENIKLKWHKIIEVDVWRSVDIIRQMNRIIIKNESELWIVELKLDLKMNRLGILYENETYTDVNWKKKNLSQDSIKRRTKTECEDELLDMKLRTYRIRWLKSEVNCMEKDYYLFKNVLKYD